MTNDTQAYIYPTIGKHKLEAEIERLERQLAISTSQHIRELESENARLVTLLSDIYECGDHSDLPTEIWGRIEAILEIGA